MAKRESTTVHDIAKELDINASTVSRALNDHPRISQTTKLAVALAAKELGYHPHKIAAALRNGKSHIIGVIIPVADRSFFASIVRGIEEMANAADYQVMICQTHEDPEKEANAVEALLNSRVDGIIASLSKKTLDFNHFLKVTRSGVPLVLFDRSNDQLGVSHVIIDDFQGAYRAVEHLIQQGCRRIGHFNNVHPINIYKERLRGYKAALDAYRLPCDESLIVMGNLQLEDGRRGMEHLLALEERPDAVFSSSDLGAMGALQVLKERNIQVPQEIALVGFSNEPFTMYCDPPLTSVDQHSLTIGVKASEIFLEEINSDSAKEFIPKKVVLMPELVVRTSSLQGMFKSV